MAVTPLRQGDPARIGRFRLTARLGAGGMGVVYLAEARGVGRVAIKVIRPEVGEDEEFRARFRREVALLSRVQGLCTVRVVEADTESVSPFLVTEYAEGPSLSEHVRRSGRLDAQMLLALAAGLAEALVAIHGAGVVHRDLKPGNVILTGLGPKVIDFGIAQALDGTVMTRTGMSLGSPGFMAPEQITGTSGQAADIFSWGLTVAYAASGTQPFGTGPAEVLPYRIIHESPDISAVPDFLRPLVEAAVSKDPDARPTAAGLLGQLTAGVAAPEDEEGPQDEVPMPVTQLVLSRSWQVGAAAAGAAGSAAAAPAGSAAFSESGPLESGFSGFPESGPYDVPGAYGAPEVQEARGLRNPGLRSVWPRLARSRVALAGAVVLTVLVGAGVTFAVDSGNSQAASGQQSGQSVVGAATPTVVFGSYSGRKPFAITLNSAMGGGTIQDIHWSSWTATGASGTGMLGSVSTQIELSSPSNGRFTRIGESSEGALAVQLYPNKNWPSGAVAALPSACTKPTSAQLLAAFYAAPASVRDGWTAEGAKLFGFDGIECWKAWVVADASGSGDGNMVFSTSGGLHLMPQTDMQDFGATVCSDPSSPKTWKGPDTGLAVC